MNLYKIIAITLFVAISMMLKAQHSPARFEKEILDNDTITDAITSQVFGKVNNGMVIKWSTLLYIIQRIERTERKIVFIDSLLKTDYWENDMRIKLVNQKFFLPNQ